MLPKRNSDQIRLCADMTRVISTLDERQYDLNRVQLIFQKLFVSFSKENNHKTDLKCHPPWFSDKEIFSL